jgi:hypothetical protein
MSNLPPQVPGSLPWGANADSVLTVAQMALWLQISQDTLRERAKRGEVQGFREGDEWRFHPRSYLAAKGQIASRWDEALNAWTKLTTGIVTDPDIKRSFWKTFPREFAWFDAHGPAVPAT